MALEGAAKADKCREPSSVCEANCKDCGKCPHDPDKSVVNASVSFWRTLGAHLRKR